jgi:hypothetical protein
MKNQIIKKDGEILRISAKRMYSKYHIAPSIPPPLQTYRFPKPMSRSTTKHRTGKISSIFDSFL